MSLSTQSAKRRTSFIEIEKNPFEGEEATAAVIQIENLGDTVKIEPSDLNILISTLENLRSSLFVPLLTLSRKPLLLLLMVCSDNVARIQVLHSKKTPYLFASEDLLKILAVSLALRFSSDPLPRSRPLSRRGSPS
jgi:hypothetical protein